MVAALIMAAVGNHTGAMDAEAAAQALDHRQQRGDVGGVAGPEEGGDGPIILIQHDAQHDLMQLWSEILRVAPSAQRGAAYTAKWCRRKQPDSAPNSDLR